MVRDVLVLLMGELQADIHTPDWRNRLALHHAAVGGHIENVVFLLQNRNCLNSESRVIAECEVNPLRKTCCCSTWSCQYYQTACEAWG